MQALCRRCYRSILRILSMHRFVRRLPLVLAVLAVLTVYAFVGSGGEFEFRAIPWHYQPYAGQAEGFLRGHLHMANPVPPALMALSNPWDEPSRAAIDYMWDVSYFNGRYYLYFSPLPAILVHIPHRLVRGAYPRDSLVAAIFFTWAFLAAIRFIHRSFAALPRKPLIPFPIWVLLAGLGTIAPFLLAEIRMYEVAIAAGTAMTAMWAVSLLSFLQEPTIRRAVFVGLWLALAINARPNLAVLLFVTAAAMFRPAKERGILRPAVVAALIPLSVVGLAMLWYNYARFLDPFEFGTSYQLTFTSMHGVKVCSLCTLPEVARFFNAVNHYLFAAPTFAGAFPFVDLPFAHFDPAVSFPASAEEAAGVVALIPLTAVGTFLGLLLVLRRERLDPAIRTSAAVLVGGWLVLFGLSTCWWIVSRYSMDFMLLMVMGSALLIESGLLYFESVGVRIQPLRIACITLACYSIVLGLLLGFVGQGDAFKRLYPEKFKQVAQWFGG